MRTFIDTQGVVWDVWEVRRDHVAGYGLPHSIHPELEDGWLCFASRHEKRRLAPFPDDWTRLGREQLEALCANAHGVRMEHRSSQADRARPRAAGELNGLAAD